MRAAIYARVASHGQWAMEVQVNCLMEYAKEQGYEVVAVVCVCGPAIHRNSDTLKELFARVEQGDIDVVLCRDPSRLSRKTLCYWGAVTLFKQHGVAIQYLPPYDQIDYDAKLNLLNAIGQCEMEKRRKHRKP